MNLHAGAAGLGVIVLVLAVVLHQLAGARAQQKPADRGPFWGALSLASLLVHGAWLGATPVVEHMAPDLLSLVHPFADLRQGGASALSPRVVVAALLPVGLWLLLGCFFAWRRPQGDWMTALVGCWGCEENPVAARNWVVALVLPLAVLLIATLLLIGRGASGYPLAAWAATLTIMVSLCGVAYSRPVWVRRDMLFAASEKRTEVKIDWPIPLRARGIEPELRLEWEPSDEVRAIRSDDAATRQFLTLLRQRAAAKGMQDPSFRYIAAQMLEAVAALVESRPQAGEATHQAVRLVAAPDECGQAEVTALASDLLYQRQRALTLVIVPDAPQVVARQLREWTQSADAVVVLDPEVTPRGSEIVLVCTAQVLSDVLLPGKWGPANTLGRFGFIVWWRADRFTGVLGANMWAISRRLQRLLRVEGRHDVRTLVLLRAASAVSAQTEPFVNRLLPLEIGPQEHVSIAAKNRRRVLLYTLQGARDASSEDKVLWHLGGAAARASVMGNFTTALADLSNFTSVEQSTLSQLQVDSGVLGDRLEHAAARADARIVELGNDDALSLSQLISCGASAIEDRLIEPRHDVGVLPPENVYIEHLLRSLRTGQRGLAGDDSRRLICAEKRERILQRHLLSALAELPGTRDELLDAFLRDEQTINKTIEALINDNHLGVKEVRYLREGELCVEPEYRVRYVDDDTRAQGARPLDTVGLELVTVYDPYSARDRMHVDPERKTIVAFPGRVFFDGGQRCKVRPWGKDKTEITCEPDDRPHECWRVRTSGVTVLGPYHADVMLQPSGALEGAKLVRVRYREEVEGTITAAPRSATGSRAPYRRQQYNEPLSCEFETVGLALSIAGRFESAALPSLAVALAAVLPVHIGVEEDAIAVVPERDLTLEDELFQGLVITDLYPGGIGLVEAIASEPDFMIRLLDRCYRWLQQCPCQSAQGCPLCVRTPAAEAVRGNWPIKREAALTVLQHIRGRPVED